MKELEGLERKEEELKREQEWLMKSEHELIQEFGERDRTA